MRFGGIGVILILVGSLAAQVRLSEIMFRPDTLSNYTEFVEIVNTGNTAVDLTGWKIGDSLDLDAILPRTGNAVLLPGQYGIILDPGYFEHATIYDALIPDTALILTIEDASFGRYGLRNAPPLTVYLYNAEGELVDSYRYSSDNPPGYSDEKIDVTGPNSPQNWANSRRFRGTPGIVNSVTPQPIDLAIASVDQVDSLLWDNQPFNLVVKIANLGTSAVEAFSLSAYHLQSQFKLIAEKHVEQPLFPAEEQVILLDGLMLPPGFQRLRIVVEVTGDADTSNNVRDTIVFVESSAATIIINEIMFEPRSGESEWVELFNGGDVPLNLTYYFLTDFRDTLLIPEQAGEMLPGEYWVLTGDSALMGQVPHPDRVFVLSRFPTLNNDVDELSLLSPAGRLLDRVRYSEDWYGHSVPKGTSLEKINPWLASQNSENWTASVAEQGSTPTEVNSVFVETPPVKTTLQIQPNPFSPDNDGQDDFTIISVQLPSVTGFITCRIFDTRGRLVRTLAINQPVGSTAHLVWNGLKDNGALARLGMYIVLVELYATQTNERYPLKGVVVLVR